MEDKNSNELEEQKRIAYAAGLLQGDITIKRLLESLAEGVVIINEHGRIILINSRFAEMSGYSKMEAMGKDLSIFINPGKHEVHKKHLASFFSNPHIRPMGAGLELTVYRKDKSTFPVEISLSFLDTESGRIGIGFITDITERKKAVDALTRRNIELNAYAHTVAHNLKSSLDGITGFSELILQKGANLDTKKRTKYVEIIADGSKKMKKVIRELLLFASLDKIDIEMNIFSMKDVIDAACSRLKFQINKYGATINVTQNIIDCISYSSWVEEIWYNYISNALNHGGDKPQITITSERTEGGYIKYSVIDNGPGLSEESKQRIFDGNSSGATDLSRGSGFGLSIVKRIAEKLDGYVSIESEPGKGSEFSFYLKE